MNAQAERHLVKAQGYLEKGEAWYRKAAAEIVAAQEADSTLTNREIGEKFGRSKGWVGKIVLWATSDQCTDTPFAEPAGSVATRHARSVLRDAPLEQIEQLIAGLPKDRQQAIGAAAGQGYLSARQDYDEAEKHMTPAEKKEREAIVGAMGEHVDRLGSGFASLGIAGHIDQATEELSEMESPTAESMRIIVAADAAWRTELQVKVAMVDLDYEPIEV